ncbi:helix-turn-helix domain-containing protein [Aliivibrio fischeri]|uniref:helix-turn-helix domain-containing protein n=1 Tax=Aliivibrio fischeri TaxID=668 RepID=UPI0007C56F33|nr:helix-turn-helix transcriptional regulator [Aliivibrio fischeri]
MIKNNKQLALTKKRIEEFSGAISKLQQEEPKFSPLLAKAQIDALICQRDILTEQASEYELLLAGDLAVFDVNSISDLPKALIMSRISMGLTQKDLADRLGMKEQQIQRYENTEYSSASFKTLVSIVEALDLKITEDVFLPKESREKNILLAKLNDAGLDKSFIEKRISPRDLMPFEYGLWVDKTVEKLNSIFGWTRELLLGDSPLVIGRDGSMVARFKMPVGANEVYTSAYTQYAYSIANIVANNSNLEMKEIPQDFQSVRECILAKHNEITFESVLAYVTELGVPVISLNDSGAFHGATWRIEGRNIIVLKQKSRYTSKWMFDLLHELYHASQSQELKEFSVVELSETSDERRNDQEEIDANNFAAKVLLGESAELYIEECFKNANGNIAWLKNSVIKVAEKYELNCGVLAYQVANKLDAMSKSSGSKRNWWGAANNLQENTCEPNLLCFETLLLNINLENLDIKDRDLLEQISSE